MARYRIPAADRVAHMVFFRFAAVAAFLMLRRAAAFGLADAMDPPSSLGVSEPTNGETEHRLCRPAALTYERPRRTCRGCYPNIPRSPLL